MKIVIVGAGEVGFHFAEWLALERKEVVVIDIDPEALIRVSDHLDVQILQGSGSNPRVLEDSGLKNADIILALTDKDEVNLIACFCANVIAPQIQKVARIRNPDYIHYREALTRDILNIGLVINPEMEVVNSISAEMIRLLALAFLAAFAAPALAATGGTYTPELVMLGPVPLDFVLFAAVLLCVALFHHYTFQVAVTGVIVISAYKILITGLQTGPGLAGFLGHLGHEWVLFANLFCLLMGFALLSKHFEDSNVPAALPKYLPGGWKGAFALLAIVFVLSSFLDNIAAALIGGTMAGVVFKGRVHIGYLAAIVAASIAGGAGSVVGDTTTTMMWIDGADPLDVLHPFAAMARTGLRTLCLAPTRVLMAQWVQALAETGFKSIGEYGDGRRIEQAVTVATFASAFRNVETLGNRFDLLIIDEVHHFGAGGGDETLEMCTAPTRLGLSATVPEDDMWRVRLDSLVGPVVYPASVKELAGRYLASFQLVTISVALTLSERRDYDAELSVFRPMCRAFFESTPVASWSDFVSAAGKSDAGRRALSAWRRSHAIVRYCAEKREAVSDLILRHRDARILGFALGPK